MKLQFIKFEFKLQDLWVGVFWNKNYAKTDEGPKLFFTDIYICIIPMVPLHIQVSHTFSVNLKNEKVI